MAELLGALLMPPHVFWRLSLKELEAIIEGRLGRAANTSPMTAHELSDLMQRFPDRASPINGA